jgi:protein required for attachment to host cells
MTHHKLEPGAWVCVGDGQKALFLINEGDEKFPNLRRLAVEEHRDPPTREQGRDAPGRASPSVGGVTGSIPSRDRHSAIEETDWHEVEKERFAALIAKQINKAAQSEAFKQLIIVAPPRILGDLRHEFTKETKTKITAEIPKDLTHHTIAEIEALLMAD